MIEAGAGACTGSIGVSSESAGLATGDVGDGGLSPGSVAETGQRIVPRRNCRHLPSGGFEISKVLLADDGEGVGATGDDGAGASVAEVGSSGGLWMDGAGATGDDGAGPGASVGEVGSIGGLWMGIRGTALGLIIGIALEMITVSDTQP